MGTDIKSLDLDELTTHIKELGESAYRATQLANWLYVNRAAAWDRMSNLPLKLRRKLAEIFTMETAALVTRQGAADGTQKFLFRLADGSLIESVLIPANPALYGEASDRFTLCVSTQVGCAYKCRFCASGLLGFKRDLGAHEIVEQLLAVERWCKEHPDEMPSLPGDSFRRPRSTQRVVDNIVVMGMGEPLANYDHLLKAVQIINAPWGCGIGARKITISTSGLAPEIRRLAEDPLQVRLAVSLHGATDEVRDLIMPVNRKYPLAELVGACEYYQQLKGRMITLEYILIAGLNDSPAQTGPLAEIAQRLHAKVNLIPFNPVEGLPYQRPAQDMQYAFLDALHRFGITATLRREKGVDIDAACGQLRLKTEQDAALAAAAAGEAEDTATVPA